VPSNICEALPLTGLGRDTHGAGHELHELLADGQPEPRPAVVARRAAVHLTEPVEQLRLRALRDADAEELYTRPLLNST